MKVTAWFAIVAMGVGFASTARAEGDVHLDNAAIQRAIGATIGSVTVATSSDGGGVDIVVPPGRALQFPMRIPVITVSLPDPLPGIIARTTMLRNEGAPTLVYRDGHLDLTLVLRPDDTRNTVINTWTSSSIFLGDAPAMGVDRLTIHAIFSLAARNGSIVSDDFHVQVNGFWQIRGGFNQFSPLFVNAINREVAAALTRELRPRLDIVVGLGLVPYLHQLTGYGDSLRVDHVTNGADAIDITVTGHAERRPVAIAAVDVNNFSPSALQQAQTQLHHQEEQAKATDAKMAADNAALIETAKANAKKPLTEDQKAAVSKYKDGASAKPNDAKAPPAPPSPNDNAKAATTKGGHSDGPKDPPKAAPPPAPAPPAKAPPPPAKAAPKKPQKDKDVPNTPPTSSGKKDKGGK